MLQNAAQEWFRGQNSLDQLSVTVPKATPSADLSVLPAVTQEDPQISQEMPKGHIHSAPTVIHPLNTYMVVGCFNASCNLRNSVFNSTWFLEHLLWVGRAPTQHWEGVGCRMSKRRPQSPRVSERLERQAWGLAVGREGAGAQPQIITSWHLSLCICTKGLCRGCFSGFCKT